MCPKERKEILNNKITAIKVRCLDYDFCFTLELYTVRIVHMLRQSKMLLSRITKSLV